jgi:hypothetical protein
MRKVKYKSLFYLKPSLSILILKDGQCLLLSAINRTEIYIAAEKPDGVPAENWLPIQREDLGLNIILRVYAPDLEKMKTWKAPKAVKL